MSDALTGMKTIWKTTWLVAGLGALALVSFGCNRAEAQEASKPVHPSETAAPELTVYKEDFALVHENRVVDLTQGTNQVRLNDVSRQLDPNTVSFTPPTGTDVIATTYDLGVGSETGLIRRLAGKPVELIWASNNGHEGDRLKGILEPNAGGGFLIRSEGKIYVNPPGTLVAPSDPDIATQPGLAVQLSSDAARKTEMPMSYLTRGMSWNADYTAHLNSANSTMRLECWATVTNTTGIPYRDAHVTFVTGSPNRAVQDIEADRPVDGRIAVSELAAKAPAATPPAPMTPAAIGELYEYKSTGPATIGVDQMSRVRMMETKTVPVRFDYSVRLPNLSPWYTAPANDRIGAQLAIKFENKAQNGLGMPLPGGGIRFFEGDGSTDRYTGADTLGDTPQDASVGLTVSKVFDVYGTTLPVKTQRLDKHHVRHTVHLTLHNAKGSTVVVRVVQGLDGDAWKFASGTRPEAPENSLRQWRITVPAHGEQTLEASFDTRI